MHTAWGYTERKEKYFTRRFALIQNNSKCGDKKIFGISLSLSLSVAKKRNHRHSLRHLNYPISERVKMNYSYHLQRCVGKIFIRIYKDLKIWITTTSSRTCKIDRNRYIGLTSECGQILKKIHIKNGYPTITQNATWLGNVLKIVDQEKNFWRKDWRNSSRKMFKLSKNNKNILKTRTYGRFFSRCFKSRSKDDWLWHIIYDVNCIHFQVNVFPEIIFVVVNWIEYRSTTSIPGFFKDCHIKLF